MDIQAAKARLKDFSRSGSVHLQGPTPERAAKAGADIRIERTSRAVSLVLNGQTVVEKLTTARMRVTDSPFDRAAGRKHLHPDPECNAILAAAGRKFRSLHHAAGLETLQGLDPGAVRSSSPPAGLLVAEKQHDAWKEYSAALDILSKNRNRRLVVEAVLLREVPLADAGRMVALQTDAKVCAGIAMFKLRNGLADLAIHFGMLTEADDGVSLRALTMAEAQNPGAAGL